MHFGEELIHRGGERESSKTKKGAHTSEKKAKKKKRDAQCKNDHKKEKREKENLDDPRVIPRGAGKDDSED